MKKLPLDIEIYGESHADKIGVIVDGFPAGAKVDAKELRAFLARRAPGQGAWSTPRKEADLPEFVCGAEVDGGQLILTGETFEAVIRNTNMRPKDYENIQTVPRPGHADYGSWVKYGKIPSGGGKWSGRMTAPMCIAGGICKQLLEAKGIEIGASIKRIADAHDREKMLEVIEVAKERGDSVGGEISCTIRGVKPGVGDALFDGIEAEIARMVFAIPAVKGIEFGSTKDYGSENNDPFIIEDGEVRTATNNCGGILGGISTGMPIEFTLKVKPTPSIEMEQDSVNLETMEPAKLSVRGRHDPCILPRAVPVVEAAAAIAIYNLIEG